MIEGELIRLPRIFLLLTLGLVALFAVPMSAEQVPNWKLVTNDAGWQPRDSQGEVVFNNKLWVFGGWFNSYEAPPRDVWSSADGNVWKLVQPSAPWIHSDLSMSIVHHDKMWFMGGWYNGRLDGHSASNQVWWSTDGAHWTQATADAGWTPRIASAVVVFQGKMWLLGGTENYYFGDATSLKNDVWFSVDGRHWEQATNHAGWSPRAYHQAAVLNDRLYVFGGGNYVPEYVAHNDVWSSADGVHWRQETSDAPWHPRLWFPAVVYRDRMWILGGWSNHPVRNWGDVWFSADGKDWHEWKSDVTWKARHEHSAYVFRDKIWIAGGHANPLSSEVWNLEIPVDWFSAGVSAE